MEAPLRKLTQRSVVSCFIFKSLCPTSKETPQVALFKRSSQVSTYQHKYAAISGSIETYDTSPLEAAWRELLEETTLTNKSLRLRRQGKKFSFIDEGLSREWTIFPFALDLIPRDKGGKGEEGIQIDWEHESWAWFNPRDVTDTGSFGAVPNLAKGLRRAWFEYSLGDRPGHMLASGLKLLQDDHESGARVLAAKALDILADVVVALDGESKTQWWENARMAAWHIWKNGRESMGAAILNVMLASLEIIENQVLPSWDSMSAAERENAIRSRLRGYGEQRLTFNSSISDSFASFLRTTFPVDRPIRILTLSSSSTISRCLKDAIENSDFDFDIRVLESRPLFEGATMAADLSSATRKANHAGNNQNRLTVYTDASVSIAARDVDMLLLGADVISSVGDVCNKTGSLPAVLCARHVSPDVKVVVLADKEKVFPFDPPAHEENDEREVTSTWQSVPTAELAATSLQGVDDETGNPATSVRNIYFEWVPASMVSHVILEDGIRSVAEIAQVSKGIEMQANKFFGDL